MTSGLFMVSGMMFAKFQFSQVSSKNSVLPIIISMWKIFLPSTIFMASILYMLGDMRVDILLLYSNYSNPRTGVLNYYWFIQALMHMLMLCTVLFSIKPVLRYTSTNPYRFGLISLAVSVCFIPLTSYYDDLFDPHFSTQANIWFFVIGWVIHFSNNKVRSLYLAHILFVISILNYIFLEYKFDVMPESLASPLIVLVFGVTLLFVKTFSIIRPLDRVVFSIASSSIFIYLTHMIILRTIPHLLSLPLEVERSLAVIASLAIGYFFYNAWESIGQALLNMTKKSMKDLV